MTATHYIIHRVNLELEAPDEATGKRLQDEAVHIFKNRILPRLEELLERLVPKETVFRLETLDLDLERLDDSAFEEAFAASLLQGLEQKIERIVEAAPSPAADAEEATAIILSREEGKFAAFLHFLDTGSLPWWCEHHSGALGEDILEEQFLALGTPARMRLLRLLTASDAALNRLLLQFSPAFLRRLISWLTAGDDVARNEEFILREIVFPGQPDQGRLSFAPNEKERLREVLRQLIRQLAGTGALPNREPRDWIALLDEDFQQKPGQTPERNQQPAIRQWPRSASGSSREVHVQLPESLPEEAVEEDGIFVDHAGLVLLHPFLASLFQEFSLLWDGQFTDEPARILAVHLLQYLATGRENPPEHLLGFEKFFCGCDRFAPLPRFIVLSTSMKAEADKLLRAAIGHWRALKSTSPDGLREGFLQRPGKLIPGDLQDRLIVETRAHDILLGYLPWGYAMVKLPWLNRPLIVDWTL